MKDSKYLWAYLGPISCIAGIYVGGVWSFGFVYVAFLILPLIEFFTPTDKTNSQANAEDTRSNMLFFDVLVYSHVPILYGILFYALTKATTQTLTTQEMVGYILNVGVFIGAFGINVAHELGHREKKSEQLLARALLLPALYSHFTIEHNRGHHKNVATDLDPSSARFNENVYFFWMRSVFGVYFEAWEIANADMQRDGLPVFSFKNVMVRTTLYQIAYIAAVYFIFGAFGMLLAIAMGITGFLLLETVNYIEHYGLRRQLLANGRYESVLPQHSWNSEHAMGRIFLYELTRHSDHHFKANRKYQILRHHDAAPELPVGYPASMLMSLVPPLWFAVMNRRVVSHKVH